MFIFTCSYLFCWKTWFLLHYLIFTRKLKQTDFISIAIDVINVTSWLYKVYSVYVIKIIMNVVCLSSNIVLRQLLSTSVFKTVTFVVIRYACTHARRHARTHARTHAYTHALLKQIKITCGDTNHITCYLNV